MQERGLIYIHSSLAHPHPQRIINNESLEDSIYVWLAEHGPTREGRPELSSYRKPCVRWPSSWEFRHPFSDLSFIATSTRWQTSVEKAAEVVVGETRKAFFGDKIRDLIFWDEDFCLRKGERFLEKIINWQWRAEAGTERFRNFNGNNNKGEASEWDER